MKIFSIKSILVKNLEKAYIEGVYADTPQNRKLGRVGMTYTQYAEKIKNSEKTPLSNFEEFSLKMKEKEDSPMRKLYIEELEKRGAKSGIIDEKHKDYKTAQTKLNSYKNKILAFNQILEKFYKDSETDYLYITGTSVIGSTIQLKPFKIEDINYGFKVISEYKNNDYSSKDKGWKKEEFEVFIVREIDEDYEFDSYEIIGWEEGLASNDLKNQLKEYTKYLKKSIDVFKSDNPDVELEKE